MNLEPCSLGKNKCTSVAWCPGGMLSRNVPGSTAELLQPLWGWWGRSEEERLREVQPGEGMALGRPNCSLPEPEGSLLRMTFFTV